MTPTPGSGGEPGMLDHREVAAIGAAIAGHLRLRGCVAFMDDIRAWRITNAGRDLLRALQKGNGHE